MTNRRGPIYEVTFFIDDEVTADVDQWLAEHVRTSLRLATMADCRVFPVPGNGEGRAGRACQHILESDAALDEFVDGAGAAIETDIAAAFADQVDVDGRILREVETYDLPGGESPDCLNCGLRLRGQYCGNCGQRSRSRLISLWELISDAFGDLFEIDSRLWQTLVPLMFRPGRLTYEYLQGRRARYMPPFRMYLVMSLVFFIVAFFDPREELGLLFEPATEATTSSGEEGDAVPLPGDVRGEIDQARQEIFDQLVQEGIIVGGGGPADNETRSFRLQFGDDAGNHDDNDCTADASDLEGLPDWIARRLTPARLQQICERIELDDGRTFTDKLLDNVPAALIILLPLMALVLKALYPLSRRYYVEHLLFFVHFHAFFFLMLTLEILFARLTSLVGFPEAIPALTIVAASFYVPAYLFVALRKVYGQGRLVTLLKYIVLTIAYLAGFGILMFGAIAIAAFSI